MNLYIVDYILYNIFDEALIERLYFYSNVTEIYGSTDYVSFDRNISRSDVLKNFFNFFMPNDIPRNKTALPLGCPIIEEDCDFCPSNKYLGMEQPFYIIYTDILSLIVHSTEQRLKYLNYDFLKHFIDIYFGEDLTKNQYYTYFSRFFVNVFYYRTYMEGFIEKRLEQQWLNLAYNQFSPFNIFTTNTLENTDKVIGLYFLDFFYSLPLFFIFICIFISLIYSIYSKNIKKIKNINIVTNLTIFIYILSSFLFLEVNPNIFFYRGLFNFDIISINSIVFLLNIAIIYNIFIKDYFFNEKLNSYEFIILTNIAIIGLICLIVSFDFLSLYLSLELQSLCLYILAAYKYFSNFSTEAGLKYFILGAISSGFLLFGISIIYSLFGTTNFQNIFYILFDLEENTFLSPITLIHFNNFIDLYFNETFSILYNYKYIYALSIIFIISSFLFKLGVAPFHMWLPDVYQGAPTITTLFFLIIPKIGLISIFIKVLWYCAANIDILNFLGSNSFYIFGGNFTKFLFTQKYYAHVIDYKTGYHMLDHFFVDHIAYSVKSITNFFNYKNNNNNIFYLSFLFTSILSIIIGTFGALKQTKIKRLLAYSSISHMGFIIINLTTMNILSLNVIYIYLFIYIILNINFFSIYLSIRNTFTNNKLKEIKDFNLIYKVNKPLSFIFILNLFSMAGIPPLLGFFNKMYVFFNLTNNLFFSLFFLLILSAIGAFYYINIIKISLFDLNENKSTIKEINKINTYIIILSLYINILFFLKPNILFEYIYNNINDLFICFIDNFYSFTDIIVL